MTGRPITGAAGDRVRGELALTDLFLPFGRTVALMAGEASEGRWLDAFLLGCASLQILDDHLHGDPGSLRRAAGYLGEMTQPVARAASRVSGAAAGAVAATVGRRSGMRRLVVVHDRLQSLSVELAGCVLAPDEILPSTALMVAIEADALATAALSCPESLRRSVLRLPSSFRSFDQRPADVEELIDRVAKNSPDSSRAIAVVGLRTSGSYLAPLAVAALRRLGYGDVRHLTVRPEAYLRIEERRELLEVASRRGLVVVIDDPPETGSSLVAAASLIENCGVARDCLVIALCLFGDAATIPPSLLGYETIVVGGDDWEIHRRLALPAVRETLGRLLPPGRPILGLESRADVRPNRRREHFRRSFSLRLGDADGSEDRRTLIVEGCGLGLFGRHVAAVAAALPGLTPDLIGFDDGLIFMTVPPEGREAVGHLVDERIIVDYVTRRQRALPAAIDRSRAFPGRQPVWEVAANQVCNALGRAGVLLRFPVVDPLVRRLLEVSAPSIIDGRMSGPCWMSNAGDASLLKVEFAEGAFSHRDLFCYDAAFDVVGAAVSSEIAGDPTIGGRLRTSYRDGSGSEIDDERWLLYSLVHLWDVDRRSEVTEGEARRLMAACVQRYFASLYLGDIVGQHAGPFVALDVDGVLEAGPLGFPATTEPGAMALRALRAHGYRPVVATGRSIGEVIDRCRNYGLVGGVGEYGTVIFDAASDRVIDLASDDDRRLLDVGRTVLRRRSGIELDQSFAHSIRAVRVEGGRRRGLDDATIAEIIDACSESGRLTAVGGMGQTDFIPAAHSKASGLRSLVEHLDGVQPGPRPVALAVGDGVADLAMFPLADLAIAPANAERVVQASALCTTTAGAYQIGLAEAVTTLIGHPPGECDACRPPPIASRSRPLVDLLSVQAGGGSAMAGPLCRLAWRAVSRDR